MFWNKKSKTHKTKLTSVGCDIPDDFPSEWHEEIKTLLVKYKDTNLPEWKSFSVGWNGLVYRYRAMTEYDDIFNRTKLFEKASLECFENKKYSLFLL